MRVATQSHDAYAVDKLAAHPETLAKLRATGEGTLTSVHLFPQNLCNQRCSFCSYRLPGNKNSSSFEEGAHIPWPAMQSLLADFAAMGVQGIEVTGGGEPLAYPYTDQLWTALAQSEFATALVTNGTLLKNPSLVSERLKWARVSVDAATPETYARMRKAPEAHFHRAWRAVESLRACAPDDPEYRLGVGFVLSNENVDEVYETTRLARERGADNVRLSVTFSDSHLGYFKNRDALKRAEAESLRAVADFDGDAFRVHNLIPTRLWETAHPTQDYRRCPTKDVLCVVEGEGKVYTCCTFTGSLSGLYGKFTEHPGGFRGLWEEKSQWRKDFDASSYCNVSCLYRSRNLAMNALIDAPDMPPAQEHVHREFI